MARKRKNKGSRRKTKEQKRARRKKRGGSTEPSTDRHRRQATGRVTDIVQELMELTRSQDWEEDLDSLLGIQLLLRELRGFCELVPDAAAFFEDNPEFEAFVDLCRAEASDAVGWEEWEEWEERGEREPRGPLHSALPRDRCLPPVHTDAHGRPVPDPWMELGLEPAEGPISASEVRDAWVRHLVDTSPEEDPERARRLGQARDRLIDPDHLLLREIGVLHLPDPGAWDLPAASSPDLLPAAERIAGQLVLQALGEARLRAAPEPGDPAPTEDPHTLPLPF